MSTLSTNRLGEATSPYLLQHKDNPVHWQPWDNRSLSAAKELDRPILLSIGYAACHWCHVMAHESFEDDEVADAMNRLYVNIKVDREERPDIDQIYMAALSAMGEQGGWPLTMVLTPDGKPFWGGTYFPKHSRYGRPGFTDVLHQVEKAYRTRRNEVEGSANLLTDHLRSQLAGRDDPQSVSRETIVTFADHITRLYDPDTGGLRGAPKFPNAPFMEALWRSWARDRNYDARNRFLETITALSTGGIYDHIGGGLSRYAVDDQWLVPHFEKMLYDNAHFIRHCIWAHSETGDELFRVRIEETIAWLMRDMTIPSGVFAASLDADSEGAEGKYYVWSAAEVNEILGPQSAATFMTAYDINREGNWEGKNIPNLYAIRVDRDIALATIARHVQDRAELLQHRSKRISPGRDTKALADWNGYVIRAIAEAARYFGSESWLEVARASFESATAIMLDDARLAHVHDGDKPSAFGFAVDYASMINAALSLYEATADRRYVDSASRMRDLLTANHFDSESNRGYWMAEKTSNDTVMAIWNDQDEANPSATAQILEALHRLALVAGSTDIAAHADQVAVHAAGRILANHFGQTGFMNAMDSIIAGRKLVIVGTEPGRNALWSLAAASPDPRRTDIFLRETGAHPQFSTAGAYLCEDKRCSAPVITVEALNQILESGL